MAIKLTCHTYDAFWVNSYAGIYWSNFSFLGYGEVTLKGHQILHKQINTLEDGFVRHILFKQLKSNKNWIFISLNCLLIWQMYLLD